MARMFLVEVFEKRREYFVEAENYHVAREVAQYDTDSKNMFRVHEVDPETNEKLRTPVEVIFDHDTGEYRNVV